MNICSGTYVDVTQSYLGRLWVHPMHHEHQTHYQWIVQYYLLVILLTRIRTPRPQEVNSRAQNHPMHFSSLPKLDFVRLLWYLNSVSVQLFHCILSYVLPISEGKVPRFLRGLVVKQGISIPTTTHNQEQHVTGS